MVGCWRRLSNRLNCDGGGDVRNNTAPWNAAFGPDRATLGMVSQVLHTPRGGSETDRVPMVARMVVDRELGADVPDGARLVGGGMTSAAQLEVDAAMPGAPSAMRPADLTAWLGTPVRIVAGFGSYVLDTFRGRVRELQSSAAGRTTLVSLVDDSDAMRAPVTLPAYGSVAPRWAPGRVARYPVNASAVVVAALHASGMRVTPQPPTDCVVSIPGVFGLLPDPGLGWCVPSGTGATSSALLVASGSAACGPYGPQVSPSQPIAVTGYPQRRVTWGGGTNIIAADLWFYKNTGNYGVTLNFSGHKITVEVAVASPANLFVYTTASGGSRAQKFSVAASTGWHHVRVTMTRSPEKLEFWVDGVASTPITSGTGLTAIGDGTTASLQLTSPGVIQAAMLLAGSGTTLTAPSTASFTSGADVSTSALELDYVPPIDGRLAWEVIKEIATAEFGSAGFNEAGRFAYRNRAELNAAASPVLTLDATVVDDLRGRSAVDSIRTRVETKYVPKVLLDDGIGNLVDVTRPLWASDKWTLVPGWNSFLVSASNPWIPRSGTVNAITNAGQATMVDVGITVCSGSDGSGTVYEYANGIRAQIVMISPTTGVLWIYNHLAVNAYCVWPLAWDSTTPYAELIEALGATPGGPGAFVRALLLDGDYPTISRAMDATTEQSTWGVRTLALDENPWRHQAAAVDVIAGQLLNDLKTPRLVLDDVTVPGDVRIELGDVVTVSGVGDARVVRIRTGIDYALPDQGLRTTLGLKAL